MKVLRVSTPEADEYREAWFVFNKKDMCVASSNNVKQYIGQSLENINWAFTSVWKLWSSKCKDNVYATFDLF